MRRLLAALCLPLVAAACASSAGDARPATEVITPAAAPDDDPEVRAPAQTAPPTPTPVEPVVVTPDPVTPTPVPWPPVADDGSVRALITPTGVVTAVYGANSSGWVVAPPCGGAQIVSDGREITAVHVLIDPGHGGAEEPGAVGPDGLVEADVNLAVARLLQRELEVLGVTTLLTRTGDYRLPIVSRGRLAAAVQPLVFVSIHHNAAPGTAPSLVPGTEVYHQLASDESRRLAGLLYEEIVPAMADRGDDWVTSGDAGVRYRENIHGSDYYGVLRGAAGVVTALTEALYLTNPAEEALLRDPATLQVEAEALRRAIVRYLTTDDEGSGFAGGDLFQPGSTPPSGGTAGCVDPPLV